MKLIFDAVTPRRDVLAGELREEMFAAKLEDVVQGAADPIYQDPLLFFRALPTTAATSTGGSGSSPGPRSPPRRRAGHRWPGGAGRSGCGSSRRRTPSPAG